MNMPTGSALPDWLTPVAWTYIAISLLSAALIAADIHLLRHRHADVNSELVRISSALYLGPFAIPAYVSEGRASATPGTTSRTGTGARRVVAVLPGGGASAVAHLVAVYERSATGAGYPAVRWLSSRKRSVVPA